MFAALFFASALAGPLAPQDVSNPRHADRWVSDEAGLIDAVSEATLNSLLEELHRDLTVEVAVVTAADVQGTPKRFAADLFNHWQLGNREANNGLLVVMVVDERRLEMETGYGLEAILPDGWLGLMQADAMVPLFKSGDFGGGLLNGIRRIDERLRANPEAARLGTAGAVTTGDWEPPAVAGLSQEALETANIERALKEMEDFRNGGVNLLDLGLGFGFGGLGLVLLNVLVRRRRRFCPSCKTTMRLLDDLEEDEHLDEGQEKEEKLCSRDWLVRLCDTCGYVGLHGATVWFSGFRKCPQCSHRTLKRIKKVLSHATYSSGGRVRRTDDCKHCSHHRTHTYRTAKLEHSSSSSSSWSSSSSSSSSSGSSYSGGSSFGGGSSGGGGAGSSW